MSQPEFSASALPETLIVARHGHYPTNAKTFSNWQRGDMLPDIPPLEEDIKIGLDALGREQGARLGRFIFSSYPDLEVVISSDWRRAVDTAKEVSSVYTSNRQAGLQIVQRSEPRERDRGSYRAKPRAWLEQQPDYPVFLNNPTTWIPNLYGKAEHQGETLNDKAAALHPLRPLMSELAAGKTLAITAHGEVAGGAALIAFAGFDDEQLKKPLPGCGQDWMPRTIYNCGGYIFTALQNNRYSLLMGFDASKEQIRTTNWIPVNG